MPAEGSSTALRRFCERYAADFDVACGAKRVRNRIDTYSLEDVSNLPTEARISAIRVRRFGRFGNNVMQLVQAIHIAQKIGASRIYLGEINIGDIARPLRLAGLEFVPQNTLRSPEPTLVGHFYHRFCFGRLLSDLNSQRRVEIMSDYLRPMMNDICRASDTRQENALYIHIRSGDIFEGPGAHPGYVQPPLAFYAKVIRYCFTYSGISRVVLVFEDRKNPCIDALITYLSLSGITFETQSGALANDISRLAAAKNLAVGNTSFAPMIALIFRNLTTIYGFRHIPFRSLFQAQGVHGVVIKDALGSYIRNGEWKNTKEQRRQMLDYPASALVVSD